MHARTSASAALAAAALLALPAAASAKTVIVSPVKVKAYSMSIMATDGGATDDLMFMFNRSSGKSFQSHNYRFSKGVKVTVKGSKATIKGSLGRYGSVNLKLNATKKSRGTLPKGCTGKPGTTRSGVAAGKLRLVADKTYFRTISKKKLNAVIPGNPNIKCSGGDGNNGGGGTPPKTLSLSRFETTPAGSVMLSITKTDGRVTQMVSRNDDSTATAPASIFHSIFALTDGTGLSANGDLSSATAKAKGPFLVGSLSFTGEPLPGMSMGTLSGSFAAKFDSIGTLPLTGGDADAPAMLSQS